MEPESSHALRDQKLGRFVPPEARFRYLDRLVPPQAFGASREELLRARLTVAIGLGGGAAIIVCIATSNQYPSLWLRALTVGLAAIYLAVPIAQRACSRPWILRNILIGVTATTAVLLTATTGGRDLGGLLTAVMIPLVSVLICGVRAGAIWSALVIGALMGTAVAMQSGFEPPYEYVDAEAEALWSLWAGAAVIALSLGIAMTYDRLRVAAVRMLEAERMRADIAFAQQLEAEARFRSKLEALVEERSQELCESRERLRRVDRLASIGTLAAGVAHQINNPIGSILMSAQFALQHPQGDDREEVYREVLEANAEQAQRCGRIVHNLLAFARNAPAEKSPVELNELIQQAVYSLSVPTTAFDLRLCREPLHVMANSIEIEQVVVNLVRNALQSGQPEGAQVEITAGRSADHAVICVTDQGRGIESSDRDRIFDPFFTTRIHEGGTGLGLSLVHTIVEDHGGRVEVLSKPGRGTQFSVSLPLAPMKPETDALAEA